ncbi:alpha/beta hydrolase [Gallaecimonas kandeliae]|uniref:dienelactone hydrolase family protein n=1 Tax=Gallaecimonas kandeliae TaxID=3029055 RepID=UPI002649A6BB|nr:alpha/beta hydrolase [Gallaecimonas kandeliae]WKE64226.1 alpha/beta hydrolase [Gallaecimonas kandeliae]
MMEFAYRPLTLQVGEARLEGNLTLVPASRALVVFAHGSGSSRFSPRNRQVAQFLNQAGLGTLLFDLLTQEEHRVDELTRGFRFDIPLLARRLVGTLDQLAATPQTASLSLGLFGASTGAAAALIAAAERPKRVAALVSRGGRVDLAGQALAEVQTPSLFIVGGEDREVLALNRQAMARIPGPCQLEVVEGATHLFEEPGALEQVMALAAAWFERHLLAEA